MANVPLVSHEEAIVTKRHVAILAETLVAQEDQIMDYCGTSGNLNASLN
jgi:hypothetical protein